MSNEEETAFRSQIRNEVKNILNIGSSQYKRIDSYKQGDGWVITYYDYAPININLLKNDLLNSHLAEFWDFDVRFVLSGSKTIIKLIPHRFNRSVDHHIFTGQENFKISIIEQFFAYKLKHNVDTDFICEKLNLSKQDFIQLLDLTDTNITVDLLAKLADLNHKKLIIQFA